MTTPSTDPYAALLAAARALQRDGVSGPALAALFEAVDLVGDNEAEMPRLDLAFAPDPPICTARGCWRTADLPTGTCFAHSPHGQGPPLWQRARMRDVALGGGEQ
jgi:hypothetical protein